MRADTTRIRSNALRAFLAFAFFCLIVSAAPEQAFAQSGSDPVIICEYCNGDGTSGTPPGQQNTGSTSGYATGTNNNGQTVQFPIEDYPSNLVSNLSPIDPANAAKISVPMGYTIAGQTPGGDPVLQRPDGGYTVIYMSRGQVVANSATGPSTSPTPRVQVPDDAGNPSGQMVNLLDHVRELIPYVRRQIERPLLEKFSFLGMILASLILLFSFIRVIRENDGASRELYFWFGRAIICMMLFAFSSAIISHLYKIGRTLTIPIESEIEEKRTAFNDQYKAFIQGHFVVRDSGNVYIEPMYLEPGEFGWVGILTDQESGNGRVNGIKTIESATNLTGWSMPKLFFGLNVARGILQAGEIFLIVLGGFIMIGLRLAAPFMVAVAVDQKLAQRITYPFIWGTIVFTLVFPVVRDVLTFIAYTVGSFGLALYDGSAPYTIDTTTSLILKNNAYDPHFIIIITLVTMAISGLMLWASPYLAYRLATGQLFEAVSSTASGWMAAIIGSAIEFTGLKAGAALQRQAENTQTQGSYQGEMTRAKGTLEASNLGAQARKISGLANIEGNRQATLGAILGGQRTALGMAQANTQFVVASTGAQTRDATRQTWARANQSMDQFRYSQGAESIRIATESSAAKRQNWGGAVSGATGGIPVASQIGGGVVSPILNNNAITIRNRGMNDANNTFAQNSVTNEQRTANTIQGSQLTYQQDMNQAAQEQLGTSTAAINEGAGIAAGGANRGAAISAGGVTKAYALEVKANEVQFGATQEAAGQVRDANMEAAHLRELSTIVTGVARDMDRRIEEGMKQRY